MRMRRMDEKVEKVVEEAVWTGAGRRSKTQELCSRIIWRGQGCVNKVSRAKESREMDRVR